MGILTHICNDTFKPTINKKKKFNKVKDTMLKTRNKNTSTACLSLSFLLCSLSRIEFSSSQPSVQALTSRDLLPYAATQSISKPYKHVHFN